jgi:hypothetical protein
MKRGVDGWWVRERKKERRRKAESNEETDETRCLGAKYLFYFFIFFK